MILIDTNLDESKVAGMTLKKKKNTKDSSRHPLVWNTNAKY
jgi:hypothetical protein